MAWIRNRGLTLLVGALLCGVVAHAQQIPEPKPVWSIDLRQEGFAEQRFVFSFSPHPRETQSLVGLHSLAYGRGRHIGLAFLTQEIGGRGSSLLTVEASRKLHLVSLDAATGKVIANRSWPAPGTGRSKTDVGATIEGDFVVRNDNALCVYAPDLQEKDRIDLPIGPPVSRADRTGSDWAFSVAPGGNVVFLEQYLNGRRTLRMLSSSPLREMRRWDNSEELGLASEKYLAKLGTNNTLYIRSFDTPWRGVADLPLDKAHGKPPAEFVNEDTVIVSGHDFVKLIRADGQVLFSARPPKGRLFVNACGSLDGRFVAVAAERMTGITWEGLDMYRHPSSWRILVFDTKSGKTVCALKFSWQRVFAFAPDSSSLALLSGEILELFSLPQPSK